MKIKQQKGTETGNKDVHTLQTGPGKAYLRS